jgi:uncharacterized delta-60 repeat protein
MRKERRTKGRAVAAALGLATLAIGVGVAGAAPADLDLTFSGDGAAVLDAGADEGGFALAVQPDRKIVMVGRTSVNNDAAVFRLTRKGNLDSTFDGDGLKTIDSGDIEETYATAIQPDGKILVAGRTGLNTSAVVYRLNPNGSLDPTFDGDGARGFDLGGDEIALGVAVQTDGKIVFAGATSVNQDVAVWRVNSNGSPDLTFDGDGVRTIDSGGFELGQALAIQPDGKIVVVGSTSIGGNAAVYRLNPSGSLDPTFDGDGAKGIDSGGFEAGYAVAIQPDNKIVVAGHTSVGHNGALYRLNPNGSFDSSFDGDGALGLESGGFEEAMAVKIQPNGKIVVGGVTSSANGDIVDGVVYRVKPTGALDARFDGDGQLRVAAAGFERGQAIALQSDGKILFGGTGRDSIGNGNAVVVRLQGGR